MQLSATGSPHTQSTRFTAISRKVVRENVHETIPKGNMGIMINTLFLTLQLSNLLLLLSLNSSRKHTSVASRVILSKFFGEQWIQNHPQYLSGLSRALFPTTFLEIAVCHSPPQITKVLSSRQNLCSKSKQPSFKFVQRHSH